MFWNNKAITGSTVLFSVLVGFLALVQVLVLGSGALSLPLSQTLANVFLALAVGGAGVLAYLTGVKLEVDAVLFVDDRCIGNRLGEVDGNIALLFELLLVGGGLGYGFVPAVPFNLVGCEP